MNLRCASVPVLYPTMLLKRAKSNVFAIAICYTENAERIQDYHILNWGLFY